MNDTHLKHNNHLKHYNEKLIKGTVREMGTPLTGRNLQEKNVL